MKKNVNGVTCENDNAKKKKKNQFNHHGFVQIKEFVLFLSVKKKTSMLKRIDK